MIDSIIFRSRLATLATSARVLARDRRVAFRPTSEAELVLVRLK